jgi:hypothetical protein
VPLLLLFVLLLWLMLPVLRFIPLTHSACSCSRASVDVYSAWRVFGS